MTKIKAIKFNRIMEDEVAISSGLAELICTSSHGLGGIEIEMDYSADLHIHTLDPAIIAELPPDAEDELIQIDNSYAYLISGTLKGEHIQSCGFLLAASFLPEAPDTLNGKRYQSKQIV